MGGAGLKELSWPGYRGRAGEWRLVTRLLRAAEAGRGGVLLIEGPSGMGKSRLLAEAIDAAAEHGFMIARGRADELRRLDPLAPLMSALGESARMWGLPAGVTPSNVSDLRMWLVDQLRTRLEERLVRGAMLVTLDDLQWADPLTLLALRSLVPDLASYPVVWMLARTSDDNADLNRLYDVLQQEGGSRVVLEPLGNDAISELAEDVLGGVPETGLLAQAAVAGGNPFLLVELLGGLRDEAAVELADGHARLVSERLPRLPRRVQVFARSSLDRLSPQARRLLQAAAVLGHSFSVDDLAELLEEPAGQLLTALEEALATQIVVSSDDKLAFRHHMLWQAVTDSLSPPVRRWLHLQAGEVLLKHGGSAVHAAAHFMVHARPGDERVLAGLDRAAREVLPSSPRTAADLAMRALDLTDVSDPARFDRTVTAVDALTATGQLSESAELARAGLGHAPPGQAPHLRHQLALNLLFNGRPEEALVEVESMLDQPDLSDDLRDAAQLTWFVVLIVRQDIWRGRERAEAILAARDHRGASALAGAHVLLRNVAWAEGRVADGLAHIREAARIAAGGSLGAHSVAPRLSLAICLVNVRQFKESEDVLQAVDEEIGAMGHTVQAAGAAFVRAYLRLVTGRLNDAAAEAKAGLEIADELGTHSFILIGVIVLAVVSLLRGDLPAAVHYIERYHVHATQGMAFPPAWVAWGTAVVAEAQGGPKEAMRVLRANCPDIRMWRWHLVVESNLAAWATRTALAAGDRPQARTIVSTIERLAHDNPDFPMLTRAAAHARGILHKDAAALGQAMAGFRDPWARASAAEDLGVLLAGTSGEPDHEAAIHGLDQALEGYEQMGALRDAARVRARLRRFGVRRRHWAQSSRPEAGWDSLTDTERSVATLVAQGLTNKQAGAQMFLSPHTVKYHLRQVFRKLDIGSRVELASIVAERASADGDARG
ncbi:helix-turn-helix transcriptional regulator [Actinoallomurus bryophytorum]|uniref:helix-turn-helix transcriptional regulator n=1 Tax=Actinoallomurus bryophytorum TaxID=1490222 RepID=UPI00163A7BE6|nr:LuxR family transcriptional regulator [Actinoallomurus bryophytorum]